MQAMLLRWCLGLGLGTSLLVSFTFPYLIRGKGRENFLFSILHLCPSAKFVKSFFAFQLQVQKLDLSVMNCYKTIP